MRRSIILQTLVFIILLFNSLALQIQADITEESNEDSTGESNENRFDLFDDLTDDQLQNYIKSDLANAKIPENATHEELELFFNDLMKENQDKKTVNQYDNTLDAFNKIYGTEKNEIDEDYSEKEMEKMIQDAQDAIQDFNLKDLEIAGIIKNSKMIQNEIKQNTKDNTDSESKRNHKNENNQGADLNNNDL